MNAAPSHRAYEPRPGDDAPAAAAIDARAVFAGPRFAALPPLALYVHIPWCIRKCPYCDFNSHMAPAEVPETAYVAALIADVEAALTYLTPRLYEKDINGDATPMVKTQESNNGQ
jgi:oxygen-independent coproporphyrinogen-3 oxidase